MPKTKKDSSSGSDSGPDDKNPPPPAKKSKSDSTKDSKGDSEAGTRWTLEKLRFVNVKEFRGRKSVDIREHYEKDGQILPGKKGIALTGLQWRKLLEVADEVTKALEDQ